MPFINLNEQAKKEIWPGFKANFVHTDNLTIAFVEIDEGAELPEHAHEHEQVLNIIEGRFEVTAGGETKQVGPGESVFFPSNVPHSARAITKLKVIDVFHPVREDFK